MSGHLEWNPLKFGDVLGLTKGPLSGDIPGKLTDFGLDLQGKLNPFISSKDLSHANELAPYIAAAFATFGGSLGASAAPEGGGGALDIFGSTAGAPGWSSAGPAMPAAIPETPATLSQWGMTQTGPGEWTQTQGFTPKPSIGFNNLPGMGGQQQQGMIPHRQPQGPLMQQMQQPFVPVYPGVLSPFTAGS